MSFILTGAVVVAGIIALAWMFQRTLIYFPFGNVPGPPDVGLTRAEVVTFPTADGLTLRGWFVPSSGSPPAYTVLVLNGNAGNRTYRAPLAVSLQQHGLQVLLFDYRGYGGNEGKPTEAGLRADAQAARSYLLDRDDVDASRLIYFGESLGTALAIGLAAEDPPAGVILRSPFPSLVEVGQRHYPFLPVRLFLQDRFAAIDDIQRVTCQCSSSQESGTALFHSARVVGCTMRSSRRRNSSSWRGRTTTISSCSLVTRCSPRSRGSWDSSRPEGIRPDFASERDRVAERLTPEQLAEGQKLAREWFEAHPPE